MSSYQTQVVASEIIQLIFDKFHENIIINNLVAKMPQFISHITMELVQETRLSVHVKYQSVINKIQEENIISINKIQKDSLMPKQLSQQKVKIQSPKRKSPSSSTSSARKLFGFKKKDSSNIVNRLQSISFSDNKTLKHQGKLNNKNNLYIPLKNQEQEDIQQKEAFHLRQRTQNRLNQIQNEKNLKKEREQKFKQKLMEYQHLIQENKQSNITYDYEGDALKSKIKQEKVQLKMMKTGIGFASKRIKDGYNFVADSEHCDVQIRKNRIKSKQQQIFPIKASHIPVFPMKLVQGQDIKNLKLQQYRKFYDFKYSRSGFGNKTIEMNKTTRQDFNEESNNEKKIIKETQKLQTFNKTFKSFQNQKKIALPRLHGKYKVLDRYQQL